ncbi:MAG TPA: multidrug ABC transporter ATP-binding protein [Anaerolinea thermolimosa]|uniref:ABC-type multidrug transport system, ATPase and permease components n=2 Tax=Anaerolinea thermolimosa TaxID=229919 RepID=A0A3D1JHX0_9CHLR|nr:ABC transporter ATP-binding protein [Anaerolinea thermolimosa]GAP08426.1 ABC-type multidrug transport system, ATPase and permease components [Anaerolinea thermolimosa]HCE17368.1 multidrug ABC transporter ATP-binding protein [Anaerolinea thermolimosa]
MSTPNMHTPTPGGNGKGPSAPLPPMKGRPPMGGMIGRGGPMAMMKGETARDFKGTMRKLIAYLGPHRIATLVVLVLSMASTVFSIFGPKILGQATTKLFEGVMGQIAGTGSGIDFNAIGQILLTALGLYVLSAILAYVQGWVMSGVSVQVTYRLRRDIAEKINRMPLRYFDGTNHGEILSRITNDVDTVNQTLSQSLSQIITSVTTVVGVLIMMISISWQMTLVALLIIPLSLVIVQFIVSRSQRYFRQQQDYLGHVNGHIEEMFGGHVEVKAFNAEKRSIDRFSSLNATLYNTAWKSQFLSGIMMPMMGFVGNLGYVGVVILGSYLAVRNLITLGDIQAFIQYVRSFTQPITQLANISNVLQQTAAAAERVFEFLGEEEEVPEAENPIVLSHVEGRVEFQNVSFGYTPEKMVIKNFSTKVEPGMRVAIVGPTGAGKTTLVKLLMRFYDVNSGAILIDGHDIRNFRRADLRCMFGMVLQDTWLFNGTIMENIRYGSDQASDEEVIAAARAAHADYFIRSLPGGYQMVLNEETSNISAGQKQLITIARAFLNNPAMLILDEATSSVDTHTELLIQQAMRNLMRGRTSFIIAHRLSTIRDADWILVVNEGDIVEQGTHDALLAKGGFYAELYNSQFIPVEAV